MDAAVRACPFPSHAPPVRVPLVVLADHDCSYLPGRVATSRAFFTEKLSPDLYHQFMDAGFRRSGKLVYQPICRGCRACLPLRVPTESFEPSKSQRRCWRRNQDLLISARKPEPTDEKFALYRRYQAEWHGKPTGRDERESFESFLYESPVESVEVCYRNAAGALLGVGICDVSPRALSSVYFYHEPAESKRGLGTFAALYEIAMARSLELPHYYLGYWVAECAAMAYKASFRPCQVLDSEGQWRSQQADDADELSLI